MQPGYRIIDERERSCLRPLIVHPYVVAVVATLCLVLTFRGLGFPTVLGVLWLGLNSIALNSPALRRELLCVAAAVILAIAYVYLPEPAFGFDMLHKQGRPGWAPYVRSLWLGAMLAIVSLVAEYQLRPYMLHRYIMRGH